MRIVSIIVQMKPEHPLSHYIPTLRKEGEVLFLESQKQGHPSSIRNYLAAKPKRWISFDGDVVSVFRDGITTKTREHIWDAFSRFMDESPGWLFGWFGYELKNHIEQLTSANTSPIDLPRLFFFEPSILASSTMDGTIELHTGQLPDSTMQVDSQIELRLMHQVEAETYYSIVKRAKRDIYEGAYYEINLSHPLIYEFNGDGWELYRRMKQAGPVPFGAYFAGLGVEVCCSSPERFLCKQGERVFSQPIKGTVSSSINGQRLLTSLLESEKNKAENLMIVDLVRNDLSRISHPGSVFVDPFFELQSFATVHQMVSTVNAKPFEGVHPVEIIKSCFPMGSMTGAPKIAAMKAIDAYETYQRGLYSGAIGYIKPDGDFDFNVVIRTALIQNQQLVYPVGGAITSDSDPGDEWEETLLKAEALRRAIITEVAE
ncbi:MAG: anthranilate synthase component I family protein [Bacteroidota bacterium]